jgi:hypothetical protein
MADLVTLPQVKLALRIDHDDEDDKLRLLINASSQAVLRYLKAGSVAFRYEDGEIIDEDVPTDVKLATIYLVGWFYRNPDGDPDAEVERGYLPNPVISLLYPLRDPAVA